MILKYKRYLWILFFLTTTAAYGGEKWEHVKDALQDATDSALDYVPFGSSVKKLLGKQDKQVTILKSIEKTEKSTFEKIRDSARTALETKRSIEKANRTIRDAIHLGNRLKNMNFKKMLIGQTEDLLGISLNPARYIPDTKYSRQLKRNIHYSCSKEKQTIRSMDRFLKNTGKLVGIQAMHGKYNSLNKLNKSIEKSLHYDATVHAYTTTRKLLLAAAYEKEADELLSNNRAIQSILDNEAAHLKVNERLEAYTKLQKNIITSTKLKEKAVNLRQAASKLTKVEQQAIAAEQDRLAWKSIIAYELKNRKTRK